jgi:alkylated DNA repair protein alkB family protein 1
VIDESFDEEARVRSIRSNGARFRFGAGLVNYYRSGDALAGHVDDAENDLKKPIVSFSLGSPCVFLLGGDDRDEKPSALLLRSGDAVVLARESRRRFHGVPRIFTKQENAVDGRGELLAAPDEVSDPKCWPEKPEVARYVAGGRVNISVRDID